MANTQRSTGPPDGYLEDFISGQIVKAGPEEVDATQPFSRELVEVYGYDKAQIQTRPQFRVKQSPSGREHYPVDIVVFNDDRKEYDNVYMLIETKQKTRDDGRRQLDIYLSLVPSVQIGVWYNGLEHLYLRKIPGEKAAWDWKEIPDLPRKGQSVDDIGLFKRSSLQSPQTLIAEFKDIRNYLAGNTTGITRDAEIAEQIIYLLFCKLYDEKHKGPDELVDFRAGVNEDPQNVRERILRLFDLVKDRRSDGYEDVFSTADAIRLDAQSLVYAVGLLHKWEITTAGRDVIGEAFEAFIGPALRGEEGQFFTPRNLVRLAVQMTDPGPGDYVIDPACGSGGFLIIALENAWAHIDAEDRRKGLSQLHIGDRMKAVARDFFRGIEKDAFLAKITKAYMAVVGDGRAGVFCENSLLPPTDWKKNCQLAIELGQFDVLLTNPPFGAKIPIHGASVLSQYKLGHHWKKDKDGALRPTAKLHNSQPPQIIFIERCLQFLGPGGRMAIVLPEGIVGNETDAYVRQLIRHHANILAIVDCPLETFLPSTPTKVALLVLQKKRRPEDDQGPVFMAIAEKCGHDRRGVPLLRPDGTPDDDFPSIAEAFAEFRSKHGIHFRG
jgi:type I restriction enzyme M protein